MCGRIVQSSSPEEIAREFGAAIDPVMRSSWEPHWNAAPTSTATLIAPHVEVEEAGGTVVHERLLTFARWGLVPHWAKDETLGNRLFNARAETVETLPSFRDAFKRSRVIVPIDAFYEWENPEHLEALGTPIPKKAPKQPWAFLPARGGHFALAGLASVRARTGANGAPLRTFTLITTEANAVVGRIHDRMPVMLNTLEERAAWLDERTPISALRSLLGPAPDALVSARRVSRAVSNARNEGPRLLDEIPDESVGLGL
jgi:putative SOS response-associated peptidase YedK